MVGALGPSELGAELERYARLMRERPELFTKSDILSIVTDISQISEYAALERRPMGVVYESRFHLMVVDLVEDAAGRRYAYERVIPSRSEAAVVMVPVIKGEFVLLRQFRHATRAEQLAFPRGFASAGLTAEENARKELREELNAEPNRIRHLGRVCADSGLTSSSAEVYLCELSSYDAARGEEGIIQAVKVTPSELETLVARGDIDDGYTLSALTLYKSHAG